MSVIGPVLFDPLPLKQPRRRRPKSEWIEPLKDALLVVAGLALFFLLLCQLLVVVWP